MFWVARTGSSWRDLPDQFSTWETVHSRYSGRRKPSIWQQILDVLPEPEATT